MTKLPQVYLTRLFLLLTVMFFFKCSTATRNVNERGLLDTLTFGQKDYDSMRKYFSHDSLFMSALDQRIGTGDSNAIKIKMLLGTPFDLRRNCGMNQTEINVAILSYYSSKEVTDKFREIDKTLLVTDTSTIRSETDSILESMNKLKSTF